MKERPTRRRGGFRCWKRRPGLRAGCWEWSCDIEGLGETSTLQENTVSKGNQVKDTASSMVHLFLPHNIAGDKLLVVKLIGLKYSEGTFSFYDYFERRMDRRWIQYLLT